jgi:hypothetical protein
MKEIEQLFRPDTDSFTVFVVEQRFAVGRGHDYFHSFLNKLNYFSSDEQLEKQFRKIVGAVEKSVTPVSKLITLVSSGVSLASIPDIITSLCKLFTVHEHQTAGPDVIDPIIIQEGKISKRVLNKLINKNKDSFLRPSIIIILKDNDFERAKTLLSECPDGINIKMIRNSGEEHMYKVINCGADNVASFINSFAEQCYSTCSKTKREILLNPEWADNSMIAKYSPMLFKIRTNLLFDQKEEIREDLSNLIKSITSTENQTQKDINVIKSIECVARLFRVFCNDFGGQDIIKAETLAKSLGNDVLLAQVYRYADFLPNLSNQDKEELYKLGYEIFKKNTMEDQAIYCKNNMLVQQFYSNNVQPETFREMQQEAVNNVPGMVGLSHIYNNAGVAYLYCGHPEIAIDFFSKGLDYARYQDRIVQNLALESNRLIAEKYLFNTIDDNRIQSLMRRIFDGMGMNKLPFLAADFALNVLAVAYSQNPKFGKDLLYTYKIKELINKAFSTNIMCSGERLLHMQYLASHYNDYFTLLNECTIPKPVTKPSGKRMEFILQYGYSPFDFNTWL